MQTEIGNVLIQKYVHNKHFYVCLSLVTDKQIYKLNLLSIQLNAV